MTVLGGCFWIIKEKRKPMKLRYNFEKLELDNWLIAVPVGEGAEEFQGTLKLNNSAAEIFDLLKDNTTESKIVAELTRRHGDDPNIADYVHSMVMQLQNEGVLVD